MTSPRIDHVVPDISFAEGKPEHKRIRSATSDQDNSPVADSPIGFEGSQYLCRFAKTFGKKRRC